MRWAQGGDTRRVAGAFLVAASDRDRFDNEPDAPIRGFAPMLTSRLPFPSMLLASRNHHRVTFERARFFADAWGSTFVDVGELGHMDTELGLWPQGLYGSASSSARCLRFQINPRPAWRSRATSVPLFSPKVSWT
jgi:predicted alpha/beta hydrolase family esterase